MAKLLSTAYFPPISYFAAMAEEMGVVSSSVVYIEACENYQKQSWRNRCSFYGAEGVQNLNFPVVHEGGTHKLPIKDIKVDYSTPWLIQHQRAIVSAYRMSAYFEYYQDELFAILDSRPETLLELNTSILKFFIEKTGLNVDLRFTEDFTPYNAADRCDLREAIHPKRPDTILKDLQLEKPYFQVFSQKHGFKPNLSIMDLLFNEGPESIIYLKRL